MTDMSWHDRMFTNCSHVVFLAFLIHKKNNASKGTSSLTLFTWDATHSWDSKLLFLCLNHINPKIWYRCLWTTLRIQPPHVECLPSPPREASAIQTETFHTDEVNLPRNQASLPNGSLHKMQLKTSTINSRLTLSAILTQAKIIMLIIQEVE